MAISSYSDREQRAQKRCFIFKGVACGHLKLGAPSEGIERPPPEGPAERSPFIVAFFEARVIDISLFKGTYN